jgi:hypothetical protein
VFIIATQTREQDERMLGGDGVEIVPRRKCPLLGFRMPKDPGRYPLSLGCRAFDPRTFTIREGS